jgi:HAD superfamily hydrolase (TIGR01509 family)
VPTCDLLIFDCDGVLIDSEPVASGLLANALQRAGIRISASEVHRRFTGLSENDTRRICIDEYGITDPDRIFAGQNASLYNEFARSLRPMPGIVELVRSLPHLKCVASNSTTERLRRSLGLFDLWNDFAPHIFSAEMVARPKPAPDLFHLCARSFGVDPQQCVVIDDSVHGVVGAVAAGVRAVGFIDPADPRDDRSVALKAAGARFVAEGAGELAAVIRALSPVASSKMPMIGADDS